MVFLDIRSKFHEMLPGDKADAIQEKNETAENGVELVKPAYESEVMEMAREGINKFVDSLPGLLKALDEVAKIHPFISSKSSPLFS